MARERRLRYRIVEMTPEEMKAIGYEGEEPFWATIQTSLTFLEIDRIQQDPRTFEDLFKAMTPFVIDWNAVGMSVEKHEWNVAVPPPAEAGWEVFKAIEPEFYMFLRRKLSTVAIGGEDRKNVRREPESTLELSSDESSDSPEPEKTKISQSRRQGSSKP